MLNPSPYQKAIFEFITSGRGDLVVEAVAGSGKTTTLVEASKLLGTNSALFLAFNSHIAKELGGRLPNMTCKTIHSVGFSALRSIVKDFKPVDTRKYRDILRQKLEESGAQLSPEDMREWVDNLASAVDLVRLTLTKVTDGDAVNSMMLHYGNDPLNEVELKMVKETIETGVFMAQKFGLIDFTDQIYLPIVLRAKFAQYSWLFVDEAQDLSACQLQIVLKSRAAGGRVVFVGDRSQAIYGFAGAQSDSMDKIKQATKAHELPLSVCYRCPTSHVAIAKGIVPQIEPSPTAGAGILAEIKESELTDRLTNGSLILCRKTAPLVSLCLQLIGEGLPARVKGRDVASGLIKVIDKLAKDAHFSYASLPLFVREWESVQMRKLADVKDAESRIQQVNDTASAIVAAYSGLKIKCSTLEQFKDALLALFDDSRASIWLSTIHKAKGLEADKVFIIKPQFLPLVWKGQLSWQFGQEKNLEYVAYTRSKSELYFVIDPLEQDKPTKQPVTIQSILNGVLEQFEGVE